MNVVGGLRIDEPAADLAVAVAIISSARNLSVIAGTVVTGEIGLTGEIRPVRQCQNRLQEAARIGFKRMLIPRMELPSNALPDANKLKVFPVSAIADTIKACFAPNSFAERRSQAAEPEEGDREACEPIEAWIEEPIER